jgi:xanthine dehydrogenase accessory factor
MAVAIDGFVGSVGGGVMEVELSERALHILKHGTNDFERLVRRVHRKNLPDSSGMICSGEQTVLFRKIVIAELPAVLSLKKAIETEDNKLLKITPEEIVVAGEELSDSFQYRGFGDGTYDYFESLVIQNTLDIVGGGHCALALSELMSKMDFRVRIYDDRPGLNTLLKNEYAEKISIIQDYSVIGKSIRSGPNNYVVVMTIGFEYDKVVVRELIDKEFRYFGVLGSKAKMKVLKRDLQEEGLSADRLAMIHTPIGLDINSRTPFEIAVSIAAEIISEKNREK